MASHDDSARNITAPARNSRNQREWGQGEPLAFKYMPRPKGKPSENIRCPQLGFLTDVYKLLTRAKWAQKKREEGDLIPQQVIQLIKDQDQISGDEMEAAVLQAPAHDCIGLEADKWARALPAVRSHRQLNTNAINTVHDTIKAAIIYIYSCL